MTKTHYTDFVAISKILLFCILFQAYFAKAIQCELFYTLNSNLISKNSETYRKNLCHNNVICLGKQLITGGLDSKILYAVVLQAKEIQRPIIPHETDAGYAPVFHFHVVLEYKNSIFDFDSPKMGQPDALESYFSKHFPLLSQQPVEVQRIPFDEYLKLKEKYSEGFSLYAQSLPIFRVGSLQKYLKTKELGEMQPEVPSLKFRWLSKWLYFYNGLSQSKIQLVRNYLNMKGLNRPIVLMVYDDQSRSFLQLKGSVISIHDRMVYFKKEDETVIPIPYALIDDTDFYGNTWVF